MPEKIGARVKASRERLDISQEELSRLSGVSRMTITKIECGKAQNIGTRTLIALATALKTPACYFLSD